MKNICVVCGRKGRPLVDLVITEDRLITHRGKCRDQLEARAAEEYQVEKTIDEMLRDWELRDSELIF